MTKLYLGIDTSNYTSSIGVIDEYNNILFDSRIVLEVKENTHGLRQQEAVFQHLNNLPKLINMLSNSVDLSNLDTISVSSKPRNQIDSYMPVFVVGKNQAFILSKILKTNYKEFNHQEGHIAAGLINYTKPLHKFISLHISGGTTEILFVENKLDNFNIALIGGTLDINFGQLIDRLGVYIGLKFPCGKELDNLARGGKLLNINIPISIKSNKWSNLSGLENYFKNLINSKEYKIEDIVFTLFYTISSIIEKLIINCINEYHVDSVLITGGVSANSHIREYLLNNNNLNLFFPPSELSTDNGIGIAYIGKIKHGHKEV